LELFARRAPSEAINSRPSLASPRSLSPQVERSRPDGEKTNHRSTLNFSSKKLSHRSSNRTPKLYRWADIGSEALIYFTIFWGPWAFGTVHDWAITTMNLANYGIGALLLSKWAIRWKTGYQPERWLAQSKKGKENAPLKRDWLTKTLGILTLYILAYILISILNARSTYNWDFNFFEYEESYINYLPSSTDRISTFNYFKIFLGLICCFWGVRDWLLVEVIKKNNLKVTNRSLFGLHSNAIFTEIFLPSRLNRLIWFMAINGGLLALVCIIQRLDGTENLLWIFERESRFASSARSFGPFGYRGNAVSYLNMIFPITICYLLLRYDLWKTSTLSKTKDTSDSFLVLIPISICLVFAPFVSLSRGGILTLLILIIFLFTHLLFTLKLSRKLSVTMITLILLLTAFGIVLIDGQKIKQRFMVLDNWYNTKLTTTTKNDEVNFRFKIPNPPFSRKIELFMVTNSKKGLFRENYYNASILEKGNLLVQLCDALTDSKSNIIFDKITKHDVNGEVDLFLSRSKTGIYCKVNNIVLEGEVSKKGVTPPLWDVEIQPSKIKVSRKRTLNKNLEIFQPINFTFETLDFANQKRNVLNSFVVSPANIVGNLSLSQRMNGRGKLYIISWKMLKDFLWLGSGAGTWSPLFSIYRNADDSWTAWAHSDLLEYSITLGVFGTIPLLILFIVIFWRINKYKSGNSYISLINKGLSASILGCLIHSCVDFPLQVYSILHLFAILLATKFSISR
jgi:hypothetical protein